MFPLKTVGKISQDLYLGWMDLKQSTWPRKCQIPVGLSLDYLNQCLGQERWDYPYWHRCQEIGVGLISPKPCDYYHRLDGVEGRTDVRGNNYNVYYRRTMKGPWVLRIQWLVPSVENLYGVTFKLVVKGRSWLWIWGRGGKGHSKTRELHESSQRGRA